MVGTCCLLLLFPRLVKLDPEVAARTLGSSKGMYVVAAYPHNIGAAVNEVEGGLHMAVICTYAGIIPPYKDEELVDFMAHVSSRVFGLGRGCKVPRSPIPDVSETWG
jgi:hypothetical protein